MCVNFVYPSPRRATTTTTQDATTHTHQPLQSLFENASVNVEKYITKTAATYHR